MHEIQVAHPSRLARLASMACLILLAAGCGDGREKRVRVTGSVFFQNRPVEGAWVTFVRPAARPASGTTDAQGQFVLRTFDPADGAVLGLHAITISKTKFNEEFNLANPEKMYQDLLPLRYAQPRTSGLTAEVTADGANDFRFDLTK